MAVVIRLRRTGRRNLPCFRITVTDTRFPRDGRMIESVGFYDPLCRDEARAITVDAERARYWMRHGALPSESVREILRKKGVLEPKQHVVRRRPGRKKKTAKGARRVERKARLVEQKQARALERRQTKRAARKAAAAAATEGGS